MKNIEIVMKNIEIVGEKNPIDILEKKYGDSTKKIQKILYRQWKKNIVKNNIKIMEKL